MLELSVKEHYAQTPGPILQNPLHIFTSAPTPVVIQYFDDFLAVTVL